jgi:two-component system, chemotaxis family, sensor kinase Cph1
MTNQRNLDSEFCGKVPLNQTNMIQPHGVLLIIDKRDFKILQVSENITELTGNTANEVVNKTLFEIVKQEQVERVQEKFSNSTDGKIPFSLSFLKYGIHTEFLALIQQQEDYLIMEVERKVSDEEDSFINIYHEVKYTISAIETATTIEEAGTIVVKELKRISGFDKIMIYRFDEEWNGLVIAEEMEDGMDSYLGLKFPASDIPKQAREMYRKNPYRLIPKVDYEPVRLYPVINPVTGSFTNLTDSNLRSVAGVHLEYLRNMKVVASMSTRIVKNGQLWGLISCHHRTARYLSYQMCSLFELLSNVISAKISALESHDVFQNQSHMHRLLANVVSHIYRTSGIFSGIAAQQDAVLKLLKAEGLAVILNKQIQTIGNTPSEEEVEDLVYWLQANGIDSLYQQTNLAGVYEHADAYSEEASGILVMPIDAEKGSFIIAFRPEEVKSVSWGGNPNEAITFEADGKTYHPRNSFGQWQQTVKKHAVAWNKVEMEAAENFRNFAIEYTLNN